jgi:adenosylcobinamide-GDP ribazoletransferase
VNDRRLAGLTPFLAALAYFSRIPIPRSIQLDAADLQRGLAYFPWVGLLVGLIQGVTVWLGQAYLPSSVLTLLILILGILLTGALHEDGFADYADGRGGSLGDRERMLTIMKDSRVGTYGVLALIVSVGLRWTLLDNLPARDLMIALITSQTLSRFAALSIIWRLPNVRGATQSKSSFTISHPRLIWPWLALTVGLIAHEPLTIGGLVILIGLVHSYWVRHLNQALGGYTGDCLGAVQQTADMAILSLLVVL